MKAYYYYRSRLTKVFISGLITFSLFLTSALQAQTLTVQTPNGGEVWTYGRTEIATWTGQNLGNIVSIEFSYDGGTNWWYFGEVPSGPNGGSASVSVPNTETSNALLKITDVINPAATDMSDEPFTVVIPAIIIWSPAQGDVIFNNTVSSVFWVLNTTGINLLNAELSNDNGQTYTLIGENINAQEGYTFLFFSTTPSDSCIIRLYNVEDPAEYGLSAIFTIAAPPVYTLTSPQGGEIVNTYSPFLITWTVENPYGPYCYLEYSEDSGQTWEIIDNAMNVGNSGSYEWITPNVESEECLVRITDAYSFASVDTSGMFSIFTFPETPICMVSVDSLTNFNIILWEKPVSDIIADFLVYKETDEFNVYEVIDTVGYEEIAMVTDSGSNPGMRPYRYKIGFIDVENRLFPSGDYHQTIHLTINQGVNDDWNLIWTPYIGFDYTSYKIMRKTDSGNYEQIATVSASFSSFTDFNAPPGEVFYMIKIEHPDGCNPANRDGEYASVYSNVASNSIVSVSENNDPGFTIYPIPADMQLSVSFGENITGKARLTISDLTGRVVYSEELNDVRPGKVLEINSTNFKEGMYLLQVISGENSASRKIVIKR
jgi:hypothetical protein